MAAVVVATATMVASATCPRMQPSELDQRQLMPLPDEPVALSPPAAAGGVSARLGIVLFTDLSCDACVRLATDSIPNVLLDYARQGHAALWLRFLPAATSTDMGAVRTLLCAAEHPSFWDVHDFIYSRHVELRAADWTSAAKRFGLAEGAFGDCVRHSSHDLIAEHRALAERLGVRVKPTMFIGRIEAGGERMQVIYRVVIWKPRTCLRF